MRDGINDSRMNLVLVAEEKGKIIGLLIAELWRKRGYSYFSDFVVAPECRSRGTGKELYRHYEDYCKRQGFRTIIALVQVSNENMQGFCKKAGFERGHRFWFYEKGI